MADLTIVIPAYNEERSLASTIGKLAEVLSGAGIEHELVVVDDGSTDRTAEVARDLDVTYVRHHQNRGYGAALKSGILKASGAHIGIVDADGTYPIDELPRLYEIYSSTGVPHVIGARRGANVHDTIGRWVARRVLKLIAFIATGRWIDDLNSGMRIFSRDTALQYWTLFPSGFSFTTTITIASLQSGVDVEFVPIDYHPREGKSHIKPVRDFFRFTSIIIRISFLFAPLRFFVLPGLCLTVFGLGLTIAQILDDKNISDSAVVTMLFGGQLFLNGLIAESLARLHKRPIAFTPTQL